MPVTAPTTPDLVDVKTFLNAVTIKRNAEL
jgi:hypothetical protein